MEQLNKIAPNLDKHLLYRVLEFSSKNGLDVAKATKELVDMTCMYGVADDLATDQKQKDAVSKKQDKFVAKKEETEAKCSALLQFFFDENNDENAPCRFTPKFTPADLDERKKNGDLTAAKLGVEKKAIDAFYELGQQYYSVGWYAEAATILRHYAAIALSTLEGPKESALLWGLLAADQLAEDWSNAVTDIEALQASLESNNTLVAKVWLLHWSMFTYFKAPGKSQLFIDHVFNYPYTYLNVVECGAPHLLRYCAAAAILTRRRVALRRIAKMIEQGTTDYSDSFTVFVDHLINGSRFDKASDVIQTLVGDADQDFFLKDLKDEIASNAKKLVFEDYIRVHKTVSIDYVSGKVGKSTHDTELWLANLISEAKIDAKIDSVAAMVYVSPNKTSMYQKVLEKLESIDRPTA